MNYSSFEELIDDLSDYKGYANSDELTQEELRDILCVSSDFIAFLDGKIYLDKNYVLFSEPLSNGSILKSDKKLSDGFKRALGIARKYADTDRLPTIVKPEMAYFSVKYAMHLQGLLDSFAYESSIFEPPTNHFSLFKSVLEERQQKRKRPRLYAISINIDTVMAVDREYIVATNPMEALSKLSFANKIDSRPENIKIEIVKITDVTA